MYVCFVLCMCCVVCSLCTRARALTESLFPGTDRRVLLRPLVATSSHIHHLHQLFAFWVSAKLPVRPLSSMLLERVDEFGLAVGEVVYNSHNDGAGYAAVDAGGVSATNRAVAAVGALTASIARQIELPNKLLLQAASMCVDKLHDTLVRAHGCPASLGACVVCGVCVCRRTLLLLFV